DPEAHVPADAVAEDPPATQQRLPPLLERGEHLLRRQDRRAGCLLLGDLGLPGGLLLGEVVPSVRAEHALELGIRVEGLLYAQFAVGEVDDAARDEQVPGVRRRLLLHAFDELRLAREDRVALLALPVE